MFYTWPQMGSGRNPIFTAKALSSQSNICEVVVLTLGDVLDFKKRSSDCGVIGLV